MNLKLRSLAFSAALFLLLLNCSLGSHERRGDSYFNKGKYRDALAEFLIARRDDPSSTQLLFKIGVTSTRLKDMGMACAYYDTLLALDSSRTRWIIKDLFQFGVKSLNEGEPVLMREAFQKVLDIDSTYNLGDSFYPLGRSYKDAGQYERAVRAYLKALSFSPDSPEAITVLFELAQCYEELGKYKEALSYYEDYIEQIDEGATDEVLWHVGNTAYKLADRLYGEGNLEEAQEYLKMVIELGRPQVLLIDAWFLSGEIFYASEEYDKALEAYSEVLNLNPSRTMKVATQSLERIREIKYGRVR
ncbi:MAG: tetratricopeptide repeat protein [Candidatus Glassbacteria bacterium]